MVNLDRRLSGMLALVAAAIAMVVISGGLRAIPGSPSSIPVPPAPSVGDCLLEEPSTAWLGGKSNASMDIAPCQLSARYGEIAAVTAQSLSGESPCPSGEELISAYDGSATAGGRSNGRSNDPSNGWSAGWKPHVDATATVLEPDARQRASGQSWSACLLTPGSSPESYGGSLKDSFAGGQLPAAFAHCQSSIDSHFGTPESCTEPHAAESLGQRTLVGAEMDKEELDRSCQALAHAFTGMADPTAQGQLRVSVTVLLADQTRQNEQYQRMSVAFCAIGSASDRLLTGTLFGLGDSSLPWAS